eukprot:TRINITY_DN44035_c0_g1_i1.p1 TRINITY_DN44035_c0_g1~~TRINITY_DN44035_c0_g1_i1.p1  ORF type:complete len:290 (+),score=57.27 TRINITY_DN44035_c0_g1_i1:57-926(+)
MIPMQSYNSFAVAAFSHPLSLGTHPSGPVRHSQASLARFQRHGPSSSASRHGGAKSVGVSSASAVATVVGVTCAMYTRRGKNKRGLCCLRAAVQQSADRPKVVIAVSGKRKTGKDYFSDMLLAELDPSRVEVRKFATPIKAHFARQAGMDLAVLETDGPAKEKFRADFYKYDLAERAKDPFVFAREVLQDVQQDILLITDLRQIGDYKFLMQNYKDELILIRLDAQEPLRASRGYSYTAGVDDSAVECDLDDDRGLDVPWTLRFENDGDDSKWPSRLRQVLAKVEEFLA